MKPYLTSIWMGVFAAVLGSAAVAGPGDEETRSLKRARFELRFPTDWAIDTEDPDFDPDHLFSIDSPENAFVMFFMGSVKTDPSDNVREQVKAFSRNMDKTAVSDFDSYGKYKGAGAEITGKLLGYKVTVKAFSCYVEGMTVIVVQQIPEDEGLSAAHGIAMIEKTFTILPE